MVFRGSKALGLGQGPGLGPRAGPGPTLGLGLGPGSFDAARPGSRWSSEVGRPGPRPFDPVPQAPQAPLGLGGRGSHPTGAYWFPKQTPPSEGLQRRQNVISVVLSQEIDEIAFLLDS